MSFDPVAFGIAMGEIVREAVEPLNAKIARMEKDLEGMAAQLQSEVHAWNMAQPDKGEPGRDGKDCDMEAVKSMIEQAVKALPVPVDGKNGANGKDGASVTLDDVRPLLADAAKAVQEEALQKLDVAIKALPVPKDGRDGADGKDGAPGEKGADGAGIADLLTDRDGALVASFTDGRMKNLGVIVGRDGERGKDGLPGKDGRDGLGFDDLEVEYDGEKTVTLKMQRGDVVKEANIVLPINIDRGIFKDGQSYTAGDSVTWGGSYWIAQRATGAKPDSADSGWRLAVKKGRDGKDGRDGIDKTAPVRLKD